MKTNSILYLAIAGAMAFGAVACSDDDDDISATSVPKAVMESFNAKYPTAKNVDWEINQPYYVADFSANGFETEAWFAPDGLWAMTETDYGTMVSMLPAVVSDAFYNSQYSSWVIDDVALYEKPIDSFCAIEVENIGNPDVTLFYDTYGNLINTVQADDISITPTTTPATIGF